jgi:Nup85 Nucleoporin
MNPQLTNQISGAEKFITYASDIASSLQDLYENPGPHAVFIHQLMFAVQYAQFHQYLSKKELQNGVTNLLAMFHDDVVPKSWWAVLLCDLVDLLQSCKSDVIPALSAQFSVHVDCSPDLNITYLGSTRGARKAGGNFRQDKSRFW